MQAAGHSDTTTGVGMSRLQGHRQHRRGAAQRAQLSGISRVSLQPSQYQWQQVMALLISDACSLLPQLCSKLHFQPKTALTSASCSCRRCDGPVSGIAERLPSACGVAPAAGCADGAVCCICTRLWPVLCKGPVWWKPWASLHCMRRETDRTNCKASRSEYVCCDCTIVQAAWCNLLPVQS
jgi:hypothetical protein